MNAYPYYIMLQCIKEVEVCELVQTHGFPSALESKQVMHLGKECLGGFSNHVDKWRVCVPYYFQLCVEIIHVSTIHL